jgi:hypothetical protein
MDFVNELNRNKPRLEEQKLGQRYNYSGILINLTKA